MTDGDLDLLLPGPDEVPKPTIDAPRENVLDLREYLNILRKRGIAALVTFLTISGAVIVGTFLIRPVYRAVATIQIERENPNVLSFDEIKMIDTSRNDFYRTHNMLLESRSLMRRVIQASNLGAHPLFKGVAENDRGGDLVSALQGTVNVVPVRKSRLFHVGVTSPDPALAARLANTLVSTYIEMSLETKLETTDAATAFLAKQIEAVKAEIEEKKENLQQYADSSDMVDLDGRQSIIVQSLTDLNAELTRAQSRRMQSEAKYRAIQRTARSASTGLLHLPEIAGNQLIQNLRGSLAQLRAEYRELGQRFRDDWPEMVRMRQRMDELARQISAEEQGIVAGLAKRAQSDYEADAGQERLLTTQLEKQKKAVAEMNRYSILYKTLKAEVDNKITLLDSLMKRKNETDVSARLRGLSSSNVRIVDPAEVPHAPVRPNKKLNAFLGLFLGFGAGIGVAFFLEYLDNTIKSVEDIEFYTGLPSFGVIPLFAGQDEQQSIGDGGATGEDGEDGSEISHQLVTLRDSRSAVSEAYRALRTSLLLSTPGNPPRKLLVTSSQAGEGKTTTVVNTAIALAQAGKQVLLIDADLRRPRCHHILGLPNTFGLSTYLAGSGELKKLVQVTTVRNLFVLTSGPIPPNPSELIGSERMSQLLKIIPPGIQHILLDSPPVMSVTDPLLLATQANGVMLVVRSGKTPRQLLKRTSRRLRDVNARILGVVLNSVDSKTADYYEYRYTNADYYGEEVG